MIFFNFSQLQYFSRKSTLCLAKQRLIPLYRVICPPHIKVLLRTKKSLGRPPSLSLSDHTLVHKSCWMYMPLTSTSNNFSVAVPLRASAILYHILEFRISAYFSHETLQGWLHKLAGICKNRQTLKKGQWIHCSGRPTLIFKRLC